MSLSELTRNSFQSGISALKWLGLCKLLISKEPTIHDPTIVESNLSNSVLVLYRSYPGEPSLQEYLKYAIRDGIISVPTFVSTFLQVARSPELHTPATMDTLCRIALEAHYSTGLPPIGSVVPYTESPAAILITVQNALALLRTAYSLPISQFHTLTTSASELVILLLSCISDLSQLSTAQAMVYFADANDLLQNFRLSSDVRQVLETFVISLTIMIGDDVKAAREAQIMHTMQLTYGKGDILEPTSDTDTVTLSLILDHLITYRAHNFGSGSSMDAVSLLIGAYRWCSWTPAVFYTQLLISTFMCMAQNINNSPLWKRFIVGRLPTLLALFERAVGTDNMAKTDWRSAMQIALMSLFRRADLIVQCDHGLSRAHGSSMRTDEEEPGNITHLFVQSLLKHELVEYEYAVKEDPSLPSVALSRLQVEAQDSAVDLSSYLESKLVPEISIDDVRIWMHRIGLDPHSQRIFASLVLKRFSSLSSSLDAENLSHLCKVLYTYESALEIASIHIRISDLIFYALSFLEKYDCEIVGDPRTAVSHLGNVVLFVQYTLSRFKFDTAAFSLEGQTISANFLASLGVAQTVEELPHDELACFSAWFKALFDSNSEGIEDTILRSMHPKRLLRISATLFSQAIKAVSTKKIDGDVLNNGVSYFTDPLLNWTLVGIIKGLIKEVQQRNFIAPTHMDIIQTLLLSPSCPLPVFSLCASQIATLLPERKGPVQTFDRNAIRRVLVDATGLKDADLLSTIAPRVELWQDHPKRMIQSCFLSARAHKAPSLDVEQCIKLAGPTSFLRTFWSELVISASLGEMEACRRIATFVLTMPRSTRVPPILPIFLHVLLPTLIGTVDHQQLPEQTMNIELLVAVISSVLTAALHLEWAMRSVSNDLRPVLGEPSTGMARRLVSDLRANKKSQTSGIILQRLASSQSFVANFPIFMSELGI